MPSCLHNIISTNTWRDTKIRLPTLTIICGMVNWILSLMVSRNTPLTVLKVRTVRLFLNVKVKRENERNKKWKKQIVLLIISVRVLIKQNIENNNKGTNKNKHPYEWLTSIAEHSQHLGQKESHVEQVSEWLCSKNPVTLLPRNNPVTVKSGLFLQLIPVSVSVGGASLWRPLCFYIFFSVSTKWVTQERAS